MALPPPTAALQRFVDDELLRAPLVMETALKSVFEALQRLPASTSPGERQVMADVILRLGSHRTRVVDRYVASLREQIHAELTRRPAAAVAAATGKGLLSLVDDDEVAIDVVISHTIEAIRSVAEHELRELLAFTSALAGDMDVTADHNPLRADAQARALWAAAQALPLSRGHQLAFVRQASMPFAQSLRKAYAAACTRLESEGVEPAAYRTVIVPAGPRSSRAMPGSTAQLGSQGPRGMMGGDDAGGELADDGGVDPRARAAISVSLRGAGGTAAGDTLQPELIESIGRVFAAILGDRSLPQELHAPISRLQAFAVQAAVVDPGLLDHADHGLWRFLDLFVHLAVLDVGVDGQAREALMSFVSRLVEQLGAEPRHTAQLYQWAVERLERHAAKRLIERLAHAEQQVATMQQLEARIARADTPSTFHGTLDVAHLDTVPADLLDAHPTSADDGGPDADRWLLARQPGDWLRVFTKGGWVCTQVLWGGDRGEIWLLGDGDSDHTWAIRRSALKLLLDERLAELLRPRSLLQAALQRVLRGSAAAGG